MPCHEVLPGVDILKSRRGRFPASAVFLPMAIASPILGSELTVWQSIHFGRNSSEKLRGLVEEAQTILAERVKETATSNSRWPFRYPI